MRQRVDFKKLHRAPQRRADCTVCTVGVDFLEVEVSTQATGLRGYSSGGL